MIEPNYDKILKDKIDYYGETKAAYEFAAYEYNRQYIELNKLSIQIVSNRLTKQDLETIKEHRDLMNDVVTGDYKPDSFTNQPINNLIISTDKLTEYQLEIRTRLREKFNDLQIEIGRGDRLVINGVVITGGVLIWDSRNRKDYDNDIKFFSDEIKRQYLDKRKY